MGAGNPLVYTFDTDHALVDTFFFGTEIQDVDDYIQDYADNNDGDIISKETAYQDIADRDYESFLQLFYLDGLTVHGWDDAERHPELSAEYRGDGLIIATGKDIAVVVPSGCDHYHIGFGFIPRIKYDVFWEDAHDENAHKRQWYDARGLDFDKKMDEVAGREYDKYITKCNKELQIIAAKFAENLSDDYFPKVISVRNGPWLSSPITKEQFIKDINISKE